MVTHGGHLDVEINDNEKSVVFVIVFVRYCRIEMTDAGVARCLLPLGDVIRSRPPATSRILDAD